MSNRDKLIHKYDESSTSREENYRDNTSVSDRGSFSNTHDESPPHISDSNKEDNPKEYVEDFSSAHKYTKMNERSNNYIEGVQMNNPYFNNNDQLQQNDEYSIPSGGQSRDNNPSIHSEARRANTSFQYQPENDTTMNRDEQGTSYYNTNAEEDTMVTRGAIEAIQSSILKFEASSSMYVNKQDLERYQYERSVNQNASDISNIISRQEPQMQTQQPEDWHRLQDYSRSEPDERYSLPPQRYSDTHHAMDYNQNQQKQGGAETHNQFIDLDQRPNATKLETRNVKLEQPPKKAPEQPKKVKVIKKVKKDTNESVDSKNLCCSSCGFQATNKGILVNHMNTQHKDKKKASFSCKKCSYTTSMKLLFDKHVRSH